MIVETERCDVLETTTSLNFAPRSRVCFLCWILLSKKGCISVQLTEFNEKTYDQTVFKGTKLWFKNCVLNKLL